MDVGEKNHESMNFAFPNSSPQSLHQLSSPRTPPSQARIMRDNVPVDEYLPSQYIMNNSEEDYMTEEDGFLPEVTPSGRSSISSLPASVVHHNITPSQTFPMDSLHSPSRSRTGTPIYKTASPPSDRNHRAGFRNPSSVRAMQMRDEYSDDDTTPSRQRRGSRMSYSQYRLGSAHSTPGKRLSRSLQASPVKSVSKLRKEFPLVLLHCTILPSMLSAKVKAVSEELLEAIIPEPYKKRWKLLQEKIVKNQEVRNRGVLIPHPKEDYELLEERVLETLELERPVISNGHYVGRSESRASAADSGFGSEENSNRGEVTDGEEEEERDEARCADCGGHVCGGTRWEVKVYAANGLMKTGAWGAAWSEMEKVDIQISVVLPEDVRREVEARLDAVIAQEQLLREEEVLGKCEMPDDERMKEIYGEPNSQTRNVSNKLEEQQRQPSLSSERLGCFQQPQGMPGKVDLPKAMINYLNLLLQDRRIIAIMILAIFAIVFGLSGKTPTGEKKTQVEYRTTTIVSTSTLVAVETSTVTDKIRLPSAVPEVKNLDSHQSRVKESPGSEASIVYDELFDSRPSNKYLETAHKPSTSSTDSVQKHTGEPGVEVQRLVLSDYMAKSNREQNSSSDSLETTSSLEICPLERSFPEQVCIATLS